jgi:multimeric flavodoxin WrbA
LRRIKENNMKVIAFNGSPHGDGVVHKGISLMAEELAAEGIETELINVGHLNIQGCIDCGKCRRIGTCAIDRDLVNESRDKVNAADGLIIGSPVYYGSIAGSFKSFLDRLFFPGINLKYKAAATVASLRRSGGIDTFHQLNNYLNLTQAIIVPSVYWAVIHGNNTDEFARDLEGLCIMKTMGRNMAWLMKALEKARAEIPLPQDVKREWTNFIRQKE